MNVRMWENPLTQRNLDTLTAFERFDMVGPAEGSMACGHIGAGRLEEPVQIVTAACKGFADSSNAHSDGPGNQKPLAGHRVIVSAGPTYEPIDAVRFR